MRPTPKTGDKVRHIKTGDRGTLRRFDRGPGSWVAWACVDWPTGGPGMVAADGLARVAPGLLAPLAR